MFCKVSKMVCCGQFFMAVMKVDMNDLEPLKERKRPGEEDLIDRARELQRK